MHKSAFCLCKCINKDSDHQMQYLSALTDVQINLISKQFVQWDKIVTTIEKANQPKQILD